MAQEWTLQDNTMKKGGYMSLLHNGKRVADFFPFARDTDPRWVREKAELIVRTMNASVKMEQG